MEIPKSGILVRLIPVDQEPSSSSSLSSSSLLTSSSSSSPPPITSNVKKITSADSNFIYLGVEGERFSPKNNTKIYDDLLKNTFKLWKYYDPGPGEVMSDAITKILLTKYIDVNEDNKHGGRSSRKNTKKSSKRGRSMKRYVSKSRKYRTRK